LFRMTSDGCGNGAARGEGWCRERGVVRGQRDGFGKGGAVTGC